MNLYIATYVAEVKECARKTSQFCSHPLRIQLSAGHTVSCPCIQSGYERNTCGQCITCPRCLVQWQPESMTHAPHGNKGNYENFPEIYIADVFYKPWYKQKTGYAIVLPYDFEHNASEQCMTEDVALAGLDILEAEFPHMKAWITLYPVHVALYLRWMRMAARLGTWMTRRMMYFTPGGTFASMAQSLTHDDITTTSLYHNRGEFDRPVEALEGDWNLPYFLHVRDSYYIGLGVSNPDLFISHVMRNMSGTELENFVESFGYIWASNSRHWCMVEGESFYNESVRRVLQRVAHGPNGSVITRINHWQRFERRCYSWHSTRTQCRLCRVGSAPHGNTQPAQMMLRVGLEASPYTRVLAYADLLRRRRLWGVVFCAARLFPKARAVRFVPGIGSAYKEAAMRFEEASRKTA